MAYLTKEAILAAEDRKFVDVEVPEWGGTVRIGTMTAAARDRFELTLIKHRRSEGDTSIRAALVAACAVDEKGDPLFTASDLERLAAKSAAALGRLFDAASDLNVLTSEASKRQAEDL